MGTVYRPTVTKALPTHATVRERRTRRGIERVAEWTDRRGRKHSAPMTTTEKGERIVIESRAYVAKFRDGDGIVRTIATGCRDEQAARARLVEALSGTVFRYGRAFCRDEDDAEDVLQDVILKLLEALPSFRGESALSTWAFTVARRTCALRRRREARDHLGIMTGA